MSVKTFGESSPTLRDCYSLEEVEQNLRNLSAENKIRLHKSAIFYSRNTPFDAEELISEFYIGLMSGRRKWERAKDFKIIYRNTLRSIRSNMLKKLKPALSLNNFNEQNGELISTIANEQLDFQVDFINGEQKKSILNIFSDDEDLALIVECYLDNMKRSEIIDFLELSDKDFDAKRKKIRRRIEKYFTKGGEHE